jgi:hypothetical protein
MSLKWLIEEENFYNKLFNRLALSIDSLSAIDVENLLETIEVRLSPENLYADGERRLAEAMRLKRKYERAALELKSFELV